MVNGWAGSAPALMQGERVKSSSLMDGISKSGVRLYVTNFHLHGDDDLDAPIRVPLSSPNGTTARVILCVNGVRVFKVHSLTTY